MILKKYYHDIKIIFSIVFIILIIVLSDYYFAILTDQFSIQLLDDTDILISYITEGEKDKAVKLVEEMITTWDKDRRTLEIFIDHNDIEEITITLDKLHQNLLIENFDESILNTRELKTKIELNRNKEKLKINNVL